MMESLLPIWNLLIWILVAATSVGFFLQFTGILSILAFRFWPRPKLRTTGPFPGVTLIKPCHGNRDNEEKNFDSLFHQDYQGPLQLLFVVSSLSDPIVPVIRGFLARYPHIDAELVESRTRKAYWRKVDANYDGYQRAKHELVIFSDSDTIVETDYIARMVSFLEEPGVSVVTTPQYDTNGNNFASALKNTGNNCDVACYLLPLCFTTALKEIGWGHSLGFKRSEWDQFGEAGWDVLRTHFADDQMLPALFTKAGKKVVFKNVYCPVDYSNKGLGEMLSQQCRFALCQKVAVANRWVFLPMVLGFPLVPATFLVLLTGFSLWTLKLWLAVCAARILVSFVFEGVILRSIVPTLKYFWMIPIWDLLRLYFFASAFVTDKVSYHGKTYRFANRLQLEEVREGDVETGLNGLTVRP